MALTGAQKKRDYHLRGNDIAPIPRVRNPARRKLCQKSLVKFLRTYMPHLFYRPFSKDALDVVRGLEKAIMRTGKEAKALPRGYGKTTIGIGACVWALLYGYREFVVIVGPDKDHAKGIVGDVRSEMEGNLLLLQDFPMVCYPISKLEGRAQRARSQHYNGKLTKIDWRKEQIIFPTIARSKVSGSILKATGITASIRGKKIEERRPDFVLLDDPQTRESADSQKQTDDRESTINGDILGLAGHNKVISAYMTCTVIAKDDLADRFLDHERHPDWHGTRAKLVYAWPDNELWEEYDEIWRAAHLEGDGEFKAATSFYRKNRKAMDDGIRIADKALYDKKTEVSAIQHAHNLLLSVGKDAFEAEYQNAPRARQFTLYDLSKSVVMLRVNDMKKRQLDREVKIVTAFTDVNFDGLYWGAVAFRNDRTGFIIDYGCLPERGQLVPKNANETQQKKLIAAGLYKWVEGMDSIELTVPIKAAGIDRGFKAEIVHQVARYVRARFPIMPAIGFASSQYRPTGKNVVGKAGFQCHMSESQFGQFFAANSDYYRETVQRGFLSKPGTPGSLSFYGKDGSRHAEIAEHICAETLTDKAEGKNGIFWRWHLRPGAPNHWLDAIVGCYALATWFLGDVDVFSANGGRPHRKKKRRVEKRKPKIEIEG